MPNPMDALEPLIRSYTKALYLQIESDVRAILDKNPEFKYQELTVVFQKTSEGEVYRGIQLGNTFLVDHHPDWPAEVDDEDAVIPEPTS